MRDECTRRRRIGGDEIPRRRIEGRRLMTVARRPRRIRKVMRPLLQWYYNLNLLLLLLFLLLLLLVPSETRSPAPFRAPAARAPLSPPGPTLALESLVRMCERALSAYVSRPPLPSLPPPTRAPFVSLGRLR